MRSRPLAPLVDETTVWGPVSWWRLELRAYDAAPDVKLALAVLSPKEAWTNEPGRPSVGGCLQSLAYVASLVAPAVGAAAVVGWARDAEWDTATLVWAGWLFLFSVVVTGYSVLQERRYPRAAARSAVRMVALVHIVPGVVALLAGTVALATGDVEPTPELLWFTPVVLDIGAHAVLWARGGVRPGGPQNPLDNVHRTVAELDAAERDRIRAALVAAIRRLREQGKIDDETADRAEAAPLGALALTLAPDVRSASYPAGSEDTPD